VKETGRHHPVKETWFIGYMSYFCSSALSSFFHPSVSLILRIPIPGYELRNE